MCAPTYISYGIYRSHTLAHGSTLSDQITLVRKDEEHLCRNGTWKNVRIERTQKFYLCEGGNCSIAKFIIDGKILHLSSVIIDMDVKATSFKTLLPKVNETLKGLVNQSMEIQDDTIEFHGACALQISSNMLLVIAEKVLLIFRHNATWKSFVLPQLNEPRHLHSCSILTSGTVLVAGGEDPFNKKPILVTETLDLPKYNIESTKWKNVGNLGMYNLSVITNHLTFVFISARPVTGGNLLVVLGGCAYIVGDGSRGGGDFHVEEFHINHRDDTGHWLSVNTSHLQQPGSWSLAMCERKCSEVTHMAIRGDTGKTHDHPKDYEENHEDREGDHDHSEDEEEDQNIIHYEVETSTSLVPSSTSATTTITSAVGMMLTSATLTSTSTALMFTISGSGEGFYHPDDEDEDYDLITTTTSSSNNSEPPTSLDLADGDGNSSSSSVIISESSTMSDLVTSSTQSSLDVMSSVTTVSDSILVFTIGERSYEYVETITEATITDPESTKPSNVSDAGTSTTIHQFVTSSGSIETSSNSSITMSTTGLESDSSMTSSAVSSPIATTVSSTTASSTSATSSKSTNELSSSEEISTLISPDSSLDARFTHLSVSPTSSPNVPTPTTTISDVVDSSISSSDATTTTTSEMPKSINSSQLVELSTLPSEATDLSTTTTNPSESELMMFDIPTDVSAAGEGVDTGKLSTSPVPVMVTSATTSSMMTFQTSTTESSGLMFTI